MKILSRIGLRVRIFTVLILIMLITLGTGIIMIWNVYHMESLSKSLIESNMATLHAIDKIQISLINQKGFVSYYFIDGNINWLNQLDKYRLAFEKSLEQAWDFEQTEEQKKVLNRIEYEYGKYIRLIMKCILTPTLVY